MVNIKIGRFRLVSDPNGTYTIQELGVRGIQSVTPGAQYVKRRQYGLSLTGALEHIAEAAPLATGTVRTLKDLRNEVLRVKALIGLLVAEPQTRCDSCGRFLATRDLTVGNATFDITDGTLVSYCPKCSTEEDHE